MRAGTKVPPRTSSPLYVMQPDSCTDVSLDALTTVADCDDKDPLVHLVLDICLHQSTSKQLAAGKVMHSDNSGS